jgi:hypothetical protein
MDKTKRDELLSKSHLLNLTWEAEKTKNKKQRLEQMLAERNVNFPIEYERGLGWVILIPSFKQLLGYNYFQAKGLIESGTLNFLAE